MKLLGNIFSERNIFLSKAHFASMDSIIVNSGEKGGSKEFLEDMMLMLIWVSKVNNHKIVYSFKNVLHKFTSMFEIGVFFLNLWKYMHYHSLELIF